MQHLSYCFETRENNLPWLFLNFFDTTVTWLTSLVFWAPNFIVHDWQSFPWVTNRQFKSNFRSSGILLFRWMYAFSLVAVGGTQPIAFVMRSTYRRNMCYQLPHICDHIKLMPRTEQLTNKDSRTWVSTGKSSFWR